MPPLIRGINAYRISAARMEMTLQAQCAHASMHMLQRVCTVCSVVGLFFNRQRGMLAGKGHNTKERIAADARERIGGWREFLITRSVMLSRSNVQVAISKYEALARIKETNSWRAQYELNMLINN